ncbi:hypothetical protein RM545_07390 [Zunongwangia sp. F260]|uniref:Uncharacterized protein n=1 Tax=Autumnicola lenta TaxID=3075593 RepID=A0ABU3CJH7_9FLAO|nr:hypothetical protein [Zunongwangia sp. F260]MDT0646508.1 hypothetical protein [Zunongwangia sp. F260]
MKLFPDKNFKVELSESSSSAMNDLKQHTKLTSNIVSKWGVKEDFIGQVDQNGFKVISSIVGFGALCILTGKFENSSGNIEVRFHKAFKILFSILLLYPLIGFCIIWTTKGLESAIDFLPIFIIAFLAIRFVFMELSFRLISKIV